MSQLYILGKSTYAISIIIDIYKLRGWTEELIIVKNIPDEENTSTEYAFDNGVSYREISTDEFSPSDDAEFIVGSIGKSRKNLVDFFAGQWGIPTTRFRNVIHPSAVLADTVQIGHGVHVGPMTVIAPFAILSDFSTVNRQVSVGHHSLLKEFACLNPGVNVSGLCSIGTNSVIGTGANVLDQITIGDATVIGAGSVVTRNIDAGVVAYGSPAKVVRKI